MYKRVLTFLVAVAAAGTALSASPVEAAGPRYVVGSQQQVLINHDRASAHRARLNWSGCLAGYARRQAAAMAARGTLFHSRVIAMRNCRLGSSFLGENVGDINAGGASLSQSLLDQFINQSFMASSEHRANILRRSYRYVGTAWARSANGTYFIAVEFG